MKKSGMEEKKGKGKEMIDKSKTKIQLREINKRCEKTGKKIGERKLRKRKKRKINQERKGAEREKG